MQVKSPKKQAVKNLLKSNDYVHTKKMTNLPVHTARSHGKMYFSFDII